MALVGEETMGRIDRRFSHQPSMKKGIQYRSKISRFLIRQGLLKMQEGSKPFEEAKNLHDKWNLRWSSKKRSRKFLFAGPFL